MRNAIFTPRAEIICYQCNGISSVFIPSAMPTFVVKCNECNEDCILTGREDVAALELSRIKLNTLLHDNETPTQNRLARITQTGGMCAAAMFNFETYAKTDETRVCIMWTVTNYYNRFTAYAILGEGTEQEEAEHLGDDLTIRDIFLRIDFRCCQYLSLKHT